MLSYQDIVVSLTVVLFGTFSSVCGWFLRGLSTWLTAMAPPNRYRFGGHAREFPSWSWPEVKLDWPSFKGYSIWAPPTVRHPRDVVGPALFGKLFVRWEITACVTIIVVYFAAIVVSRLYHNCLKSEPGALGLWVDLPRELEGSVGFSASQVSAGPGTSFPGGRLVPISSVVAVQRLRRRSRWVRACESLLGGRTGCVAAFVKGRWTPDLPSPNKTTNENYLLGSVHGGARCLGGGITQQTLDDGSVVNHTYLVLDLQGECVLAYPELVAKLRKYSLFRKRDDGLVGALRSRAVEWTRARLSEVVSDVAVAGAVALAMLPSSHELSSSNIVDRAIRMPPLPGHLD
ncbi:hypothetical protein StAV1_gp1 [Setosphaeria turcica ambiguivirus 1]|nr:hypothetical protein StAV1_gp1 [Setosphaeria turcica ambiguivirus 1]